MFALGWTQFVPFIVTVIVIIFTNLLIGIFTGLAIGVIVILVKSYQNSMFLNKKESETDNIIEMTFAEEITFLNKASIQKELFNLPENSRLELDIRKTTFLDYDIVEILEDFVVQAKNKNIFVHLKSERGIVDNPASFIEFFKLKKQST